MSSPKKELSGEIESVVLLEPPRQVQPTKPAKKRFRWKVEDHDSPKEIYNWTLYLSVFVFGIFGAARGLDEGGISGSVAQQSFIKEFGLKNPHMSADALANRKSNITSMVQIGSVAGALIAMFSVDKLGRIRAMRCVCIVWIIGVIVQITAHSYGQLLGGRFIEGLAVGHTTTIGPNYLSEVAPRQIRGTCGCIFAGAVYFGIMISYFAHYGTALHISDTSRNQWVIPTSVKIIMAGIIFILSFFWCIESPRWLMKVGKTDKAVENLSKIRHLPANHPYLVGEISDINEQLMAEKEAASNTKGFQLIKELLFVKANRYRFFVLGCLTQILGQWAGANAVTIYAPELFANIGVQGVDTLKMTAILGVVKFVSSYLSAFFLIDILGRRASLYCGITVQLVCELYYAIFLTVVPEVSKPGAKLTGSKHKASQGAIAALFLSGTGWCMGFNSIQYLLGSEIFPLNIRSFAQSMTMVLHFANQYGNSKALPKMMIALKPYGAFYFFCGVLAIALFWAWFFVPEVAGRSLESMDEIFNLPWYLIGRKGPELCPDYSELNRIHYGDDGKMTYDAEIAKPTHEFVEDTHIHEEDGEKDLEKAT